MPTLILARHGRTAANAAGVLAGRTGGVCLDHTGRAQAHAAADRLREVRIAVAITSPMQRCRETTRILLADHELTAQVEGGLNECDYGDWSGRPLKELADEPLWRTVQTHPSAAVFPGGEALAGMSARAVAAVRAWDRQVEAADGPDAVWLAVSHGDVIKAILADALTMHLDSFQRIVVDPASLSIIRYDHERAYAVAVNTTAGDVAVVVHRTQTAQDRVGGGAGPQTAES